MSKFAASGNRYGGGQYDDLRDRMDRTLGNLSAAKRDARDYAGNGNASPLRQSPQNRATAAESAYRPNNRTNTAQPPDRSFNLGPAVGRKRGASPMGSNEKEDFGRSTAHTANLANNTTHQFNDFLAQIETLQRERDYYANEAQIERNKNAELEKEFHVLRSLISSAQKPIGTEENLMVRSQYE